MQTKEILKAVENGLGQEFAELYNVIRTYESDTFSAEGSELTDAEALDVMIAMVKFRLDEMTECETMDGTMITEELENIRE